MKLDRTHRVALAKLIIDLIDADFIVDEGELVCLERIISKGYLNISNPMLQEARGVTFAKAISVLSDLDEKTSIEIVALLKEMSLSDGKCVSCEAAIILAIEYALTHKAQVFSVPSNGMRMDVLTTIYLESTNDSKDFKQSDYIGLRSLLETIGWKFIYIPEIVSDFNHLDVSYLKRVVRYMIPTVSDKAVESICENLCGMTTERFCSEVLYKKVGVNIKCPKPSLLIKIGESYTLDMHASDDYNMTGYSNYVLVPIESQLKTTIDSLVGKFKSMVCDYVPNLYVDTKGKFFYSGFHRSLFDVIAFGKDKIECKLVIDLKNVKTPICFVGINDDSKVFPLLLSPQEATLYILIIQESISGQGLDWREQLPDDDRHLIMEKYNKIYSQLGSGRKTTHYKDRTHINHIKNRLKALESSVVNINMFFPEHIKNGTSSLYSVDLKPNYISLLRDD